MTDTHGGGGGIRTHGDLRLTRFPSVPIRPLSHPSQITSPRFIATVAGYRPTINARRGGIVTVFAIS